MKTDKKKYQDGLDLLRRPAMPLVRLLILLYITGPFITIDELTGELNEEVDTGQVVYPDPAATLAPYSRELRLIERIKDNGSAAPGTVTTPAGDPLDPLEAVELIVGQKIMTRELETINSRLCRPCHCSLCCVGPTKDMAQEFFEIPLAATEVKDFALDLVDTPESRELNPDSGYRPDGIPFYRRPAAIYRFRDGFSLILPKKSRCPNLDEPDGCAIYHRRPEVCRRPQIFPYLLEKKGDTNIVRKKLLAVIDCPYVRDLKEEIAAYAAGCGAELVLRHNKG